MYLINTELTVNWYLLTGSNPPDLVDLDIRIVPPDSPTVYIPNAILVGDYVPSTPTTKGLVVYRFTPDSLGLWTVGLSVGDSDTNKDFYTHNIMVSVNDTFTKKYVKNNLL